jgi:hypothetical protein
MRRFSSGGWAFAAGVVLGLSVMLGTFGSASGSTVTVPPTVSASVWTAATVPSAGASVALDGLSCTSASLCAAVGGYQGSTGGPFIEMWNGSAWSVVPSASPQGSTTGSLNGVSCVGPAFCMAVGSALTGSTQDGFAESWNGSAWRVQTITAPPGITSTLESVSCLTTTSCVAVGTIEGTSTWIIGWNGSSWTLQPSPNTGSTYSELAGVSCTTPSFCMAVGGTDLGPSGVPLAEQWNGTSWSIVTTPHDPTETGSTEQFSSVSCVGTTDCEAVGMYYYPPSETTFAEGWNGSSWAGQTTPNVAGETNTLHGVTCFSATTCSAVGNANGATLALTWDGQTWKIVPSPMAPRPRSHS